MLDKMAYRNSSKYYILYFRNMTTQVVFFRFSFHANVNGYAKNCKITLKVICDQIKITCSKSDLRSDQDHDLEHHKKVITNQIVISDHSIIRSLNFLNTWVWITNEIFKKFAKHTFHTYTLSNIFFTSNF